jgi:AcrR family transcriptional regulator
VSRTSKFDRRRIEILDVASRHINIHGARGMTLTAVAHDLDLDTSSVTYYVPKKDLLVAACLERSQIWLNEIAHAAESEATPRARVRHFVGSHFDLHRRQRDPGVPRLAILSDSHALDPEQRAPLSATFHDTVRTVRGYFDAPATDEGRMQAVIATIALLSALLWMPAWIDRYLLGDFPRLQERLLAFFESGLALEEWAHDTTLLETDAPQDAQTRFLHAATNQINRHGYRGASVARIAAELGVSIGSFYHHLDNKDDLVVACFRRNFDLIEAAQARAAETSAGNGDRLGRLIDLQLTLQLRAPSPLMRISAYQALPPELRIRMLDQTERASRHVAGVIADGMADSSVRATDPAIASHAISAMIDGAAELRTWAEGRPLAQTVALYASLFRRGLFF